MDFTDIFDIDSDITIHSTNQETIENLSDQSLVELKEMIDKEYQQRLSSRRIAQGKKLKKAIEDYFSSPFTLGIGIQNEETYVTTYIGKNEFDCVSVNSKGEVKIYFNPEQ